MANLTLYAFNDQTSSLQEALDGDRVVCAGTLTTAGITRFQYLTGASHSLVSFAAGAPLNLQVGDCIEVTAYAASSPICPAIWECVGVSALLPAGASAGNVTGAAMGAMYLANPAGNYYKFELAAEVNVFKFGATGDETINATAAIQAAIDCAERRVVERYLSGCAVCFSEGTFLVTSTLVVASSNIVLTGAGPSATVLYAPDADFDILHFDGSQLALYQCGGRDFRIYTPGNATSGAHIRATKLINSMFENISLVGWYDGLISDGCGKTYYNKFIFSQENRTPGTTPRYAIDFASTDNNNSDVHVSDYQITFNTAAQVTNRSVSIRGSDGIYFSNGHQHGGVLLQPAGKTCSSVFWNNVYFDTSNDRNLYFTGSSSAYRNFWFTGCYFRDSQEAGIEFNASSTIEDVFIIGGKISQHRKSGILAVSKVNDLAVVGTIFDSNNTNNDPEDPGQGDFIFHDGRTTITASRFRGGGTNGKALYLGANTIQCVVSGASVVQSAAGAKVVNDGTTNSIRQIRGYSTKSSGQATIQIAETSAEVIHGLGVTPSISRIHLTFNSDASGVTRMWVSDVTSTQFTINVNAAPTVETKIGWFVDVEI